MIIYQFSKIVLISIYKSTIWRRRRSSLYKITHSTFWNWKNIGRLSICIKRIIIHSVLILVMTYKIFLILSYLISSWTVELLREG